MENKAALDGLFRWMEAITKGKKIVYVFLASSEQFFVGWMKKNLLSKMTHVVIGDLSKQESQRYYEHLIFENSSSEFQNRFSFEDLYNLTGLIPFFSLNFEMF